MASPRNVLQIFSANPVTTITSTDLVYIGVGGTTDGAMIGSVFKAGAWATGSWPIDIMGNAATATSANTAGTATTAGNVTGIVALANGGTNAATAGAARTNLSTPAVSSFAGNPNGNVAGNAGDFVVDTTDSELWYCQTSGTTSTAVWAQPGGSASNNNIIFVNAATTTSITGTYNNGTGGIGATITVTATGVQTFDGQVVVLNGNYLIKNQGSGVQNGVYLCTTAGAVGVQAVFTRTTNYNTPTLINSNTGIKTLAGTTQTPNQTFVNSQNVVTMGASQIQFSLVPNLGVTTTFTNDIVTGSGTIGTFLGVTGNSGVLITSGGGVPAVATTLPSGLTIPGPNFSTTQIETGWAVQTPATGFSITLSASVHLTPLNPAGTLATGTITMPVGVNGFRCRVSTTQTITALTVNPDAGHSILGAPTTLLAGQSFEMFYDTSITTWLPYGQ